MAVIAGEVTTKTYVDLEDIVRGVILDIGYNTSDVGFDGASCASTQCDRQTIAGYRHGRQ